jgi:hypothetical protein
VSSSAWKEGSAIEYYREAATIYRDTGCDFGESHVLQHLGNIDHVLG